MQILNSKCILVNEICSRYNIDIAGFSNLQDANEEVFLKLGGNIFLDITNLDKVPRRYLKYLAPQTYTNLENTFPLAYLKHELQINLNLLFKMGYILEEFTIEKKKFVRTTPEFTKMCKKYTFYKLDISEIPEVEKDLAGKIKISKNKYLVWY